MYKKRKNLCNALGASGVLPVLGAIRSHFRHDLRVLAYHRILPELNEATFAFDIELISATATEFAWQMAYVAKRFTPVSCQQVIDAIEQRKSLPPKAVMVTFDDGFRDNHDIAFPILQKQGIPALFFVSTGYTDTTDIFWFEWVVHVMIKTEESHIHLPSLALKFTPGNTRIERRVQAYKLLKTLKKIPQTHRLLALKELDQATHGLPISSADRAQSQAMNWAQIKTMAQAGMEFGSHSVSHPILANIEDAAALRQELESSKRSLQRETGQAVTALSYPVGGRDAVNAQVLTATKQAGYQLGFTYQTGLNKPLMVDPLLLKRLHIERYTTRHMFAASLEVPEFFGC
jgi:peptidoglycan/xylan/chitin deacetylase (PgdA/CDA1 family)